MDLTSNDGDERSKSRSLSVGSARGGFTNTLLKSQSNVILEEPRSYFGGAVAPAVSIGAAGAAIDKNFMRKLDVKKRYFTS